MCDNSLFNCFCVVKKYSWQTSHWKWVVLKDSCLAIYDSNRVRALARSAESLFST